MSQTARHLDGNNPALLPPREAPYVLKDVFEKRLYGCRDELILELDDGFLRFGVDSETDTVTGSFEPSAFARTKEYQRLRSAKPWKKLAGKWCTRTWLAVDEQGYWDMVLIGFDDGIEPSVLLQSVDSSLKVLVIKPAEKAKKAEKAKRSPSAKSGKGKKG